MSDTNQQTLAAYDDHVNEYILGTPHDVSGGIERLITLALTDLSKDARILELGSGFGRDANYIESLGYSVQRTDSSRGFVDLLQQNGAAAQELNILTAELADNYDLVFANAVLLHFTDEETARVLKKIHRALRAGGRLAFSLKRGDGDGWSSHKLGAPRYFNYWQPEAIEECLKQVGYTNIRIDTEQDQIASKWLYVIADK